ncbi:glycoside hydrolase [Stachybotrys elegans]|uniref:lytic cellulose monooxygenase (C4-dehydrogenating) n=1 Tax=Stachybotrys elegans TaxID=80388 RepID=A0A8K0WV59_9HYPO|nr:glycoside hydrolase [Stachybotrys elegans]
MKSSLLVALAAVAPAFAHYNFESLIVNGQSTGPYEYVRRVKNSNSPVENASSPNMICNVGGNDADSRAATKTYTVAPGAQIGFNVNANLGHPGPLYVYMSKAPSGVSASDYLGDGEWFKVYALTTDRIDPNTGLSWASFPNSQGITNFSFTLPQNLPAGDYLVRPEHIGLHGAGTFGGAQFYMGCAQIRVTGNGNGTPSPTVRIPGFYTGREAGILINIYWPPPQSYGSPGPAVWPGQCEDHTPNPAGRTSDGDCTPMR